LDSDVHLAETTTSVTRGQRHTKYQGIGGMQSYEPVDRLEYYTWNNAIRKLAENIAGGRKEYSALNKEERLSIREMAKQLYDFGRDVPTAAKAEETNRQGFVYIIGHPSWPDLLKIGRAFNPESRLKGYQTGCPKRDYRLHYAVYFEDCYVAERAIHAYHVKWRREGEWFYIDLDEAIHSIDKLKETT